MKNHSNEPLYLSLSFCLGVCVYASAVRTWSGEHSGRVYLECALGNNSKKRQTGKHMFWRVLAPYSGWWTYIKQRSTQCLRLSEPNGKHINLQFRWRKRFIAFVSLNRTWHWHFANFFLLLLRLHLVSVGICNRVRSLNEWYKNMQCLFNCNSVSIKVGIQGYIWWRFLWWM